MPIIPGMEGFVNEEKKDVTDHDGKPRSDITYFDATQLPDSPVRQKVAHGAQTYIMYIVFPSFEDMQHGLEILSGGNRKTVAKQATMTTISSRSIHKASNQMLIEWWEQSLAGIKKEQKASEDSDEAQEPVFGDDAEDEVPATPKVAKVKTPKVAPLKVTTEYPDSWSVDQSDKVAIGFPTFRRASTVKTWKYFPSGKVVGYVEPQEINTYTQLHESQSIAVLPKDGMGISEKRAQIVTEAIQSKNRWLFMLEDDFTGFFVRNGLTAGGSHKLVKSDYQTVMNQMLNFADANSIALLGLSQQQSNHFYEETHVKYSCKVTEFLLLDLNVLKSEGINYDPNIEHFEDFDIEVQLLQKGYKVGLYIPAAFGHVTMGTNVGGHQAEGTRKERTAESIEKMIVKYPGIVQLKEGRLFPEPKIDWTALRAEIRE